MYCNAGMPEIVRLSAFCSERGLSLQCGLTSNFYFSRRLESNA